MPQQTPRGPSRCPAGGTILVVMGVSGSGKTTVGRLIAHSLGWEFLEGDELHPPANIEKMRRGVPLDDADRYPWLQTIATTIDHWRATGEAGVIACSALKRRYRDIIIGHRKDVVLVYLKGSEELIKTRMAGRHGHFMPPELLASQFAALEEPSADENPIVASVERSPEDVAQSVLERLPGWRGQSVAGAEEGGKHGATRRTD